MENKVFTSENKTGQQLFRYRQRLGILFITMIRSTELWQKSDILFFVCFFHKKDSEFKLLLL
jgi:hypothetical protein